MCVFCFLFFCRSSYMHACRCVWVTLCKWDSVLHLVPVGAVRGSVSIRAADWCCSPVGAAAARPSARTHRVGSALAPSPHTANCGKQPTRAPCASASCVFDHQLASLAEHELDSARDTKKKKQCPCYTIKLEACAHTLFSSPGLG